MTGRTGSTPRWRPVFRPPVAQGGSLRRRRLRHSLGALAFAGLMFVLVCTVPENRVLLVNVFLGYGALVVGLDLLVGDLRMLPAGHAAFFGVGAYGAVLLSQKAGLSLGLAGVVSVLIVGVLALVVGLPVVARSTGFAFAIITFAIGELLIQVINNMPKGLGGASGLTVNWGIGQQMPFDFSIYRFFGLWLAGALLVVLLVVILVRNSHFGLRMHAIRTDESGTRGLGFNPVFYKTVAFVVASMLAGLIGVFWAPMNGFISPDLLGVNQSVLLLGMLVIGGIGRISGALAGVLVLMVVPAYLDLDPTIRTLLVGGLLAIVALLQPSGIAGGLANLARRLPLPGRTRRLASPEQEEAGTPVSLAGVGARP